LFSVTGTAANQGLGAMVAGIGDVSGDGIPDFAASDLQTYPAQSVPVRLFSGAGGAPLGVLSVPSAAGFGARVSSAGDVNGDGTPDVAVSAPLANATVAATGEVFVFSGAGGALLFSVRGTMANETFGSGLGPIGDRDHDGLADVFASSGALPRARVIGFAGVPAGSHAIGSGCALTTGRTPSLAAFGGDPTSATGNPFFGLIVSNGSPNCAGALAAGLSTTSWGGASLPVALGPALAGCSLYVSVVTLTAFLLGPGGAIQFPASLPASPGLAGATLHFQAYVADSQLSVLPGAVTRGLTIVVQ
jgi:hypothetical protein